MEAVKDKRVVVVDDSVVRGDGPLSQSLCEASKGVHMPQLSAAQIRLLLRHRLSSPGSSQTNARWMKSADTSTPIHRLQISRE
jgi:hypothetical protein